MTLNRSKKDGMLKSTTSGKEFFMLSPHGKKSKVDQNRSKRMTLDDTVPMGFFRVIRNITITEQNHI